MKRSSIIILLLYALISSLSAQQVTNISAQQEGREIAIYYDLSSRAHITLSVRANGKRLHPEMLSGAIGKNVEAGTRKRIAWGVLTEQKGRFKADNVVFTVRAFAPWRTFVMAEAGLSPAPFQYSAGIMTGMVSRVGWYFKARTSFQYAPTDGYIDIWSNSCDIFDKTDNLINTIPSVAMPYVLSGERRCSQWVVDGGLIARVHYSNDWMWYVYAGGGYGARQLFLQTNDKQWLMYKPTSFKNFSIDVGAIMTYKQLALTAGVNTIGFKYMEFQVGIGYIFN